MHEVNLNGEEAVVNDHVNVTIEQVYVGGHIEERTVTELLIETPLIERKGNESGKALMREHGPSRESRLLRKLARELLQEKEEHALEEFTKEVTAFFEADHKEEIGQFVASVMHHTFDTCLQAPSIAGGMADDPANIPPTPTPPPTPPVLESPKIDEIGGTMDMISVELKEEATVKDEDVQAVADAMMPLARVMFDGLDVDGSGDLDRDEVSQLAYNLGLELSPEGQAEMFDKMDADGSGEIDFDEFFAWYTEHVRQSAHNQV